MATQLFRNNASALLAVSLGTGDTTVQVASGYGALFPNPTGTEFFVIAIESSLGTVEYCRCTARSGDLLTVIRGQEGTAVSTFTASDARVELRPTRGTLERFLQREVGTNEVSGAILFSGAVSFTGSAIIGGGTIWTSANDGPASGLDADTVDGQHAAAFAAASHTHDAAALTSGTLPDGRFPATLPALSGANLTALNGSNVSAGTVATARLDANVYRGVLGSANITVQSGGTPSGGANGDIVLIY